MTATTATNRRYDTAKGAVISPCQSYRYLLWRRWSPSKDLVNFVMLNPSKADAFVDDPTIRRCVGFASSWGYGGIIVTNLYAVRATHPEALQFLEHPVGAENDSFIQEVAQQVPLIICAWGGLKNTLRRDAADRERQVKAMLPRDKLHYLNIGPSGHPYHPLYQKADLKPRKWEGL